MMEHHAGDDDGGGDGLDTVFSMPIWAFLGDFDRGAIEANTPSAQTLLWFYVLISNVVLVNVLIAMFSETYNRVSKGSRKEYCFQVAQRVFVSEQVLHRLPPPLSLPALLPDLLSWLQEKFILLTIFCASCPICCASCPICCASCSRG
jgi:hypothetical protein